jgi:uncharacterized lipoprotein YmbA
MTSLALLLRLAQACVVSAALCGCLNLKPAASTTRHFVLTSLPPAEGRTATSALPALAIGFAPVKMPAYLLPRSLAVRRGGHEIEYLEASVWAERLDQALQRVLAANLSSLLPTVQVRLSAWRRADVAVEVHLTVERFEMDTTGSGTLIARWRLASPGGEKVLKTGETRLSRAGPPPGATGEGAAATLSELAADLSRQLAQALTEVAPR